MNQSIGERGAHHLLANCLSRSLSESVEKEAREPVGVRRRVSKVIRARRQDVVTGCGKRSRVS